MLSIYGSLPRNIFCICLLSEICTWFRTNLCLFYHKDNNFSFLSANKWKKWCLLWVETKLCQFDIFCFGTTSNCVFVLNLQNCAYKFRWPAYLMGTDNDENWKNKRLKLRCVQMFSVDSKIRISWSKKQWKQCHFRKNVVSKCCSGYPLEHVDCLKPALFSNSDGD